MKNSAPIAERVFVGGHYRLLHRASRAFRWSNEAGTAYHTLFLLRGSLAAEVAGRTLAADSPAALLCAPGESLSASGSRVETLAVVLAPAYLLDCAVRARLTRDDALVTFRSNLVTGDARLARLGADLSDELRAEESGKELFVAALVEQLAVHLLRRHANVRRAGDLELTRFGLIDRRVRRAVELMHAHMDRELALGELARAAHLSPFHFARLFKKVTGAAPHAYLASLRIERAQTLLATTDASVTEVGARVGYGSPSHFARAFRQSTGLTPRAFRAALVR
jgi:AraC family transcriptional regulator